MTDEATTTSGAQAGTPVLRLSGITKRFGPLVANNAISFALGRGEVVALLGENGAGKTTLMNILFGHYVADEGTVEVFGDRLPPGDPHAALEAGIGMVHQHFTLADNMTVLENIALGTQPVWSLRLDRGRARARIAELSADFGLAVDPGRLVSALSVGERQRVEILKALYRDARILILDEPTAVLTPAETEALFATLRMLVAKGLSIIFISHKLNEVMAVSDRVLVLRGGRLAGERATAGTTRQELAALMVGREVAPPQPAPVEPGAVLARLSGVSLRSDAGRLDDVTLDLRGGEIVGLAGVSGNGQAALAALLAGMVAPASGSLEIGGRPVTSWTPRAALAAGVGRIPENRHAVGTIGDMSVAENVISERYRDARFSSRGFLDWSAARGFAQSIVDAYDVKCPSPDARIRLLSGGNMQKLILGRALDPDPSLILANQPTRGLDVGAVSYVHERLLEARGRGAAILLISEDLDEILTLSDRIVVMSRGRLSAPSARGERSVAELGELMAGHGLDAGERGHAA
ncbi:MAG: ABC transporter ATP-binding protein [Rhizobiaceae bacterium]|nr:ABC transporter ATP-binding protein [Rhizobiaceae bacterium]